jgi:tRNA-dihydrouridine synthase B
MNNKNFWNETITIGTLTVPRFMSAPLDGVTTSPFRQLMRDFSKQELLFTEMRHVAQVCNEKTEESLRYNPIEQPLAFQFSANTLDFIEPAVEKVIERKFVMINLNIGCPARTVVKSGSGSALMANIKQLEAIIAAFMKAINGRVPFTIKMRAGFKQKNALDVARMVEDMGTTAIIIHPRTQTEGFGPGLDYDLAQKIKLAAKIPIIFSGDIDSFQAAKETHKKTGVDGFMIGRALWGAPWKIHEITQASKGEPFTMSITQALQAALKHMDLNREFYGDYGFVLLKKHIPFYIHNVPNASAWRNNLLHTTTEQQMRAMLKQIIVESQKIENQ